jgi:quercetin dioxygenase-like cupin family protein
MKIMKPNLFAGACAALFLCAAAPAFAGDCPAGQVGVNVMAPGPTDNSGVALEPIAEFDLEQLYGIHGRHMRMRRVIVAPGGVFGWHNHDTRPGLVTIVSGEMTEYRSTCAVPIIHRAGEGTTEAGPIFHWWKNNGAAPAVLIAADLPLQGAH